MRAVRVTSPIRIDGRLDEAIYATTPSVSGLIQIEPHGGEPATQNTEAWLLFENAVVDDGSPAEPRRVTLEVRPRPAEFR